VLREMEREDILKPRGKASKPKQNMSTQSPPTQEVLQDEAKPKVTDPRQTKTSAYSSFF
jgi:hypothetical protein